MKSIGRRRKKQHEGTDREQEKVSNLLFGFGAKRKIYFTWEVDSIPSC